MSPPDNVIKLFPTSIQDIPAMLRAMADRIETGEAGDPTTMFAFTVNEADDLEFYGWGEGLRQREIIGILTMAIKEFAEAGR